MFEDLMKKVGIEMVDMICDEHGNQRAAVARGGVPKCPVCIDREMREKNIAEAAAARQENLIRIARVPERYRAVSFKGLDCTQEPRLEAVKRSLGEYVRRLREEPRQWLPLVLCGTKGTGKTHMLCAAINNLVRSGVSCHYTTMHTMLSEIKKAYSTDGISEQDMIWRYVGNFDLLVIDEVDVMRATDNDLSLIFYVINGRYNELRSVAVCSNQEPEKLDAFLSERVAERIRESAVTLRCDWPSYRTLPKTEGA